MYFCDLKRAFGYTTDSAIGIEVEILFFRGGEAAAEKKIAAESPTPRLQKPGQGIAQIIVST